MKKKETTVQRMCKAKKARACCGFSLSPKVMCWKQFLSNSVERCRGDEVMRAQPWWMGQCSWWKDEFGPSHTVLLKLFHHVSLSFMKEEGPMQRWPSVLDFVTSRTISQNKLLRMLGGYLGGGGWLLVLLCKSSHSLPSFQEAGTEVWVLPFGEWV
jgi:hypothetical protein